MNLTKTVLTIDDDRATRLLVTRGLADMGIQVVEASDGAQGLESLERAKPDVVLVDVMMPQMNGLELFRKIRAGDRKVPIIFVTSDASSETTIAAMKLGAFDYIVKPISIDNLKRLVASACHARELMEAPVALTVTSQYDDREQFIGTSPRMLEVFKAIGRVAAQNVPVLIRGESGCGKELVAKAIYQHSDRNEKPYSAINCAALPEQLLESTLFGHEKGAFTGAEQKRIGLFEACDGGTIFLDEVGDMSPLIQGKVLRLLQDQSFQRLGSNTTLRTNVRIVAATNRPLEKMIAEGEFREDLYYRLNGVTIDLPPLRERRTDLPKLIEYFLVRAKRDMNKDNIEGVSTEALQMMCRYDWPGNVRELQSIIRQSVLNTTGTVITSVSLPPVVTNSQATNDSMAATETAPVVPLASLTHVAMPDNTPVELTRGDPLEQLIESRLTGTDNLYQEILEHVERKLFTRVLQHTQGNQSLAAEILGITRGKVRDRIAQYKLVF